MEGSHPARGAAFSICAREIDMRRILTLVLPLMLAAGCGGSPNDPGEGGVTKAEADALDRAAEQLDQPEPPPSVSQPAPPAAK